MMTPRERVRAVLNHQEPDRVPLDLGGINSNATNLDLKVIASVKLEITILA